MNLLFVFLDESGDPGDPAFSSSTRFFVVGAVVLSPESWQELRKKLADIKCGFNIDPTTEVKWSHLISPKKSNPLLRFKLEKRREYAYQLLDMLKQRANSIFYICVDKEKRYCQDGATPKKLKYDAYRKLLRRLSSYLSEEKLLGVLIHDVTSGTKADHKLREMAQKVFSNGRLDDVVFETLLFAPSELSSGIQFADFATGAIARKFFAKDERYFERIEGVIEGVKT